MLARDVMSPDVVTIGAQDTLLSAVKLLINAGVSGLPVVDGEGALVGLLSEYDLIRHVMGGNQVAPAEFQAHLEDRGALADAYSQALAAPVASLMSSPVITAQEDTPLKVIADLMLEHQARRIPIVRGDTVAGVVSRADLMKALLSRPHVSADLAGSSQPAAPDVADGQLRQDVTKVLRQIGMPLGSGFDVVVRHGVVHLWGEVVNEEDHRTCCAAAAKVPGARDVLSHMQVMPRRLVGLRGW